MLLRWSDSEPDELVANLFGDGDQAGRYPCEQSLDRT